MLQELTKREDEKAKEMRRKKSVSKTQWKKLPFETQKMSRKQWWEEKLALFKSDWESKRKQERTLLVQESADEEGEKEPVSEIHQDGFPPPATRVEPEEVKIQGENDGYHLTPSEEDATSIMVVGVCESQAEDGFLGEVTELAEEWEKETPISEIVQEFEKKVVDERKKKKTEKEGDGGCIARALEEGLLIEEAGEPKSKQDTKPIPLTVVEGALRSDCWSKGRYGSR